MNALFEFLHYNHSALEVFFIDVSVFILTAVIAYALVFLAKYHILKAADRTKGKVRSPKYLNRDDKFMWDSTNAVKGGKKR